MELKWKTRGDVAPGKKSRVYFCCHEADFDTYFEPVTLDILQLADCAVWYRDSLPAADDEEYISQLQQMQLFVMPVTTRLLTTANAALDMDFPIAQAEHIPVLPLMQEPGLEELFNAKCGTLMVLDKHAQDATALKFEDKLKRFLDAVLVGDEQAARIRAAFDAYIFLSYRKKDRKYAQELMGLIHKNEFARDIAIWYDEFLTPGEDFNTNIGAALDKSVLYALTVTPNLLERGNYIMEHEYPAACSAGKPILPVEMLHTDRAGLEQVYAGLPDSIADEAHLSAALADALQTIALRQNDQDPEHNFFIGLAYLGGIDVERDPSKALSLITSAGEAGLPEAMDKLSSIYANGEGIPRDMSMAIAWQERLTEYRRKVWEESGHWRHGNDYAYALMDLLFCQQDAGRIADARASAQLLYDRCRDKDWGWDHSYMACICLGDMDRGQDQPDSAMTWYQEALKIAKDAGDKAHSGQILGYNRISTLSYELGDADTALESAEALLELLLHKRHQEDIRKDLYAAFLNVAQALVLKDERERAIQMSRIALTCIRSLITEQNTEEHQRMLQQGLTQLATKLWTEGAMDEAQSCLEESMGLNQALLEQTNALSDQFAYTQNLSILAPIRQAQGDCEAAHHCCSQAIARLSGIATIMDTESSRFHLARAYYFKAELFFGQSDYAAAAPLYQKVLEIVPEPGKHNANYHLLYTVNAHYAQILEADGGYAHALPHRKQANLLADWSFRHTPRPDTAFDLAASCNDLGQCLNALGHREDALTCYDQTLELVQKQKLQHRTELLSVLLKNYAVLSEAPETAERCRQRLTQLLSLLPKEDLPVDCRENMVTAYRTLGDAAQGTDAGESYYLSGLALSRALSQEASRPFGLFHTSNFCTELGRIRFGRQALTDAEAFFTESIHAAEQLLTISHKPGDRRRCSTAYSDMGTLYRSISRPQDAERVYLRCLDLDRRLLEDSSTAADRRDLGYCLLRLGECRVQQGDYPAAEEWFLQCRDVLRPLSDDDRALPTLTAALDYLAQLRRVSGDNDSAAHHRTEISRLYRSAADRSPTLSNYASLARAWRNQYLALGQAKRYDEMAELAVLRVDELEPLAEQVPEVFEPHLAMALANLSLFLADPADEAEYKARARQLAEKYPNDPDCIEILG